MLRSALAIALLLAAVPASAAMQEGRPLKPSETVWKPAPTPQGGVSWAVLESTKEITRKDANNMIWSKPAFTPQVKALAGKRIKVNGYMMPLQNGEKQTHFVLLAYPPDCPFHLQPAPMQFIEVRTSKPIAFDYDVRTIEGTLTLHGQDESGVFYRISDGREG
jgi:uncharacterized protein